MPRSDPLILGKDGEILRPTPSQQSRPPWLLSVLDPKTGRRKTKRYVSYQEAKIRLGELQAKYESLDIVIISRQVGYGPPRSKVSDYQLLMLNRKKQWWCPYCRRLCEFLWSPKDELKHCQHCGISQRDFHVIRCNPILWSNDKKRTVEILGDEEE